MKKLSITPDKFTRVKSDYCGNPRYVAHYLDFITESEYNEIDGADKMYNLAHKRAKECGGKKCRDSDFGGGFVFQSYSLQHTCERINETII